MINKNIKEKVEKLSIKQNIKNLEREKGEYLKNIEFHEGLMERLNIEEQTLKKRYSIMLQPEKFKILRPNWEYEKDPEYVETLKLDIKNKQLQDESLIKQNRDQIEKTIKLQNEALNSVMKELERLNKGEKKNE